MKQKNKFNLPVMAMPVMAIFIGRSSEDYIVGDGPEVHYGQTGVLASADRNDRHRFFPDGGCLDADGREWEHCNPMPRSMFYFPMPD